MGASGLALPLSARRSILADGGTDCYRTLGAAATSSTTRRQFRNGGEVVLRKQAPDGKTLEMALDCDEAAALLGEQHLAVREARAFTREARQRELARLEGEVARLRESLRH
jgi:hypothetical protein